MMRRLTDEVYQKAVSLIIIRDNLEAAIWWNAILRIEYSTFSNGSKREKPNFDEDWVIEYSTFSDGSKRAIGLYKHNEEVGLSTFSDGSKRLRLMNEIYSKVDLSTIRNKYKKKHN